MIQKPIYKPKGRAGEYGDLAINIYTGCSHRCAYCYAPAVLRLDREKFHTHVEPRSGIVESVKRQIRREWVTGKLIHLCFTCDPYPAGIDTTPTREIIEAIKGAGNHVQILTKGGFRAERDYDLLDEGDKLGASISGGWTSADHEPGADTPYNRLWALATAKSSGITTWVSCEPVIDPDAIYDLIRLHDYIDHYKIGKMNYRPSSIDWWEFGRKCEQLCQEFGRNYYIKDDLRRLMEATG
jgi:DNA repair photolyase